MAVAGSSVVGNVLSRRFYTRCRAGASGAMSIPVPCLEFHRWASNSYWPYAPPKGAIATYNLDIVALDTIMYTPRNATPHHTAPHYAAIRHAAPRQRTRHHHTSALNSARSSQLCKHWLCGGVARNSANKRRHRGMTEETENGIQKHILKRDAT